MNGTQVVVIDRRSATAPRLAAAGAVAVAVIIIALHAIKPEFEPSWRFISEYAIGRHGWIMQLAFLIWAASLIALAISLRGEVKARAGKSGALLLLIVAGSLVFAGMFPQIRSLRHPMKQRRAAWFTPLHR